MNYSHNIKYSTPDYSSQIRFSFPLKNHKPNNISFKNSVQLINSEKKPNNHRQYLIDFIRDNNNKNRKSPDPNKISPKMNSNNIILLSEKIEEKKEENEEIIDKKLFFNDYFNQQTKFEKNNYNKIKKNEQLIDICDYIGEDSKRPIELDIMNIKMNNFIPGRISSKSFGLINSYAANTNQGIDRNYNDDRVKIMINMNKPINYINKAPWPLISYFGIFDGHNGDQCAEFLRQNLLQYIYTNPNFPKNIEKSIKEGFIKADEDFLRNNNNNNYNDLNYNYNSINYDNSGSCGLILLIVDTKIYIANVGDSRCIVSCNNGKIKKDVTRDHKPEFPYEKKRIYNNGGNIYRNETVFNDDYQNKNNKILLGPYRVNPGKLSVSRTIGDARAKLQNLGGIPNVIIPEPDIYVFDFYKDNIDYFILGCDGIFDRLKSTEVFECVNVILNKSKELLEKNIKYNNSFNTNYDRKINMNTICGNIVDLILRASMIRKSYDNVTCVIVAFKDLLFENNNNEESKKIESYNLKNNKLNENYEYNKDYINKNIITNNYVYEDNDENNKMEINKIKNENNKYEDYNNCNFINIRKKRFSKYQNDIIVENQNEKEKKNINEKKYDKRFSSQSQEKKIRELISLFSINNKKNPNNEGSKILYRSYNSKENNENDIQNKKIQNEIYNRFLFNSKYMEKINKKKHNISVIQDIPHRLSMTSKNRMNLNDENNLLKRKKISFLRKRDLNSNQKKKNYSCIKKYKSITKRIGNTKMNSFLLKPEIENKSINNENDKIYNYYNNNNNISNRIKSNSTDSLYDINENNDTFSKRITTRKIVRKTNNFFNSKNNLKERNENNFNLNLTMNNKKNNFFYSMTSSNKEKNNNLRNSIDNYNKIINLNISTNKNHINNNNRNLRYFSNLNNSNDFNNENEYIIDKYFKDLSKSGKYEKIKNNENLSLPVSSSVGIIYTKKNKIK